MPDQPVEEIPQEQPVHQPEEPQNKPQEEKPKETEPEITTNVDDKGAYVFNKNNEKVYLVDKDGFNIDPKDAVNMAGSETEEDGFYVGGVTDGEKVPNISWEELQ